MQDFPAAGLPAHHELFDARQAVRFRDLGKLCAFVIFAALCWLAGRTTSSPRETVLKFWAMGREGEVVMELLPEFERTHPGIRVEVQQLPWSAAHEKLPTAFAGDAKPDLCQLGNTWIPEFVALQALERTALFPAP